MSLHNEFEVRSLPGPLGAEVLGLDLSQPLSDAGFRRLHRAHLDHHVLEGGSLRSLAFLAETIDAWSD